MPSTSDLHCAVCGTLLSHIDEACPKCLPLFEARDLAILICPLPEQLDDGDAIERMPGDLFRAASMMGDLSAEVQRLREKMNTLARVLAPGNRTLDEMIRDMGIACDLAREETWP